MPENLISIIRDACVHAQPFGVDVARVWTRQRTSSERDAAADRNPYKFGDLPTSWAESFRRCLEGALVAKDLLGLPDKEMLAWNSFSVRGGQYGSIHISRNVSLFVDGWYSEIEPTPTEQIYSCISVPTELLFEVHDFFAKNSVYEASVTARRGAKPEKIIPFKSHVVPEISFTISFPGDYPEVGLAPTLHEFGIGNDGRLLPPQCDGKTVAYGEVSLSEAQTLQLFSAQLADMPINEISITSAYVDYVLENGTDYGQDFLTHSYGMIYVASDIISFIFPPDFLKEAKPLQDVSAPTAIPTAKLGSFMRTRFAELQSRHT
jgi:hypothetical protein